MKLRVVPSWLLLVTLLCLRWCALAGRNLGLTASVVTVAYSGGSIGMARRRYDIHVGDCTVVVAGTHLRCSTVPGVGANYTFEVTVDGVTSSPSNATLSYGAPGINSVELVELASAPTRGGAAVRIHGYNFGPDDAGTVIAAWASPSVMASLEFPASACVVEQAHVTIRCITGSSVGSKLTWRVAVEGQVNSAPVSVVSSPSITTVLLVNATHASTSGGTVLQVTGDNFGAFIQVVRVAVRMAAGDVVTQNCTFAVVYTVVRCKLPAGIGRIWGVMITVLDQSVDFEASDLWYAPPVVSGVNPNRWGTDLNGTSVQLVGSGFGSPALSSYVQVSATAASGCAGSVAGILSGRNVIVRSDGDLSFELHTVFPHVVRRWELQVSVAGQALASGPLVIDTSTPELVALAFNTAPNSTHNFLTLVGTDFGDSVTGCVDDASVSVGGAPCDALSMAVVRVSRLEL